MGASGVYTTWEDVERLVVGEVGAAMHAEYEKFSCFADATDHVQARTLARARRAAGGRVEGGAVPRAVDLQPGGRQTGSVTKAAGLLEKLSSSRLGQILGCIEGQCAFDKHDGTETPCRAGCGRTLHVATCAQLGRGYAAIGNFTCPDCRILASGLTRRTRMTCRRCGAQ